jgi:hypothetical protein
VRRSVPFLVACLLALATGLTLVRLSDLPSSPLPHRAWHGSDSPAVVGPAVVGPTGTTNPHVASQRGVGPAAWAPAVSAARILAPTGTALARAGSVVAVRNAEDRSLVPAVATVTPVPATPAVAPGVPSSAEQPLCYGEPPSATPAACPVPSPRVDGWGCGRGMTLRDTTPSVSCCRAALAPNRF